MLIAIASMDLGVFCNNSLEFCSLSEWKISNRITLHAQRAGLWCPIIFQQFERTDMIRANMVISYRPTQVVRGVEHLHTQGLIHNNISPCSIWVSSNENRSVSHLRRVRLLGSHARHILL